MNRLTHTLVRPVLRAVADRSFDANGTLPMPPGEGEGRVQAPGPDPDRLLLIGTAAASGLGVVTHQLGLAGQLARRISAVTHRGVDVTSSGHRSMTALRARELLTTLPVGEYDAVVLEIGSVEAVGLQTTAEWRRQIHALIEAASVAQRVFVVGIPHIPTHTLLPKSIARVLERKVTQLNAAARQIAGEYRDAVFLPLEPRTAGEFEEFGTVAFYESWAEALAGPIARHLAPELHRQRTLVDDEPARQVAVDELGLAGAPTHPLLAEMVHAARNLLGAAGSAVTLIDHDRQWMLAVDHMDDGEMARADAFCDLTIRRPEVFVVEDTLRDERFAGNPLVVGERHVRSYAGYPIESPTGHRIGALCVIDTKPRQFSATETALLRDLALQVQGVLWSMAKVV